MAPSGLDDAALVRQIAAGSEQARACEAALVSRFAPRVRLYGLRHLRSEAAADDLVQAVMLVVLERVRAGELREPERIASFVLGTSRLIARDSRRGEQRRAGLLDQFGAVLAGAPVEPPPVEAGLDHQRLAQCLERLGPRERTVIALGFYEDRSADDIATTLGMTAGNVRVVRHRALGRLATCMGAT